MSCWFTLLPSPEGLLPVVVLHLLQGSPCLDLLGPRLGAGALLL